MCMNKNLPLYFFLLLFITACNNDDDLLTSQGPIIVNTNPVELDQATFKIYPGISSNRWLIISDQQGEVLSCHQVSQDTTINISDEALMTEGGYNLSIGSTSVSDVILPEGPPTSLDFVTYTNLRIPEIKFNYTAFPTVPYTSNSPAVWVSMDVTEDEIDYVFFSSTVHTNPLYKRTNVRVYLADQAEDIFVMVKLKNEDDWRMGIFPQQEAGSTLVVKVDDLELQAAQNIKIPAGSEIQWGGLNGIVNCGPPVREFFIQHYNQIGNTEIETVYPSGFFDRFETFIYLKQGDEEYELNQMGDPISEYLPVSPAFRVNNANPLQFELEPEPKFTTYRTLFSSTPLDEARLHTVTFLVWGEFSTTFRAPQVPDCIRDNMDWVREEEARLQLHSVAQYDYSNLADYIEFIGYQLDADLNESDCSRNNFNGDGRREIRTKKY